MDFLRRLLGTSGPPAARERGAPSRHSVPTRRVVAIDLNDGWPRVPAKPRWPDALPAEIRNALPFESERCPGCGVTVTPLPKGTKKCKECGEQMHVVVVEGSRRRLVNANEREAALRGEAERTQAELDAAERRWYAEIRSVGLRLGDTPGDGESLDVVGESHYLEVLASIMAALRQGERDREVMAVARLVREPTNRYDRNAVKVEIHGRHVGHLSREDAEDIQRWLKHAEQSGPVYVLAQLGGGFVDEGRVGPIGVTLEELPGVFG